MDYLRRDALTNLFLQTRLERFFNQLHPSSQRVNPWFRVLIAEPHRATRRSVERDVLGICVAPHRLALPVASHPTVAWQLGRTLQQSDVELSQIVGEDQAVSAFWEAFRGGHAPRLNRRQRYCALTHTRALSSDTTPLRLARSWELDAVVEAASAMYMEETLSDPMATSPETFRLIVRQRILDRRCYVWTDAHGDVLFKADVSCSNASGVLISGVYTRPDQRRRGLARRGLAHLCRILLQTAPAVVLYVNEDNRPALRLYEGLGFDHHRPYRTVFID